MQGIQTYTHTQLPSRSTNLVAASGSLTNNRSLSNNSCFDFRFSNFESHLHLPNDRVQMETALRTTENLSAWVHPAWLEVDIQIRMTNRDRVSRVCKALVIRSSPLSLTNTFRHHAAYAQCQSFDSGSRSHCVHGKCFVLVCAFLSHSYVPFSCCCSCCCCKYLAIEASSVECLPVLQALRVASSAARLALQAGAAS